MNKTNKETIITKATTLHSTYSNPYITSTPSLPPPAPNSSFALNNSDNHEERKHPYRAAIIPENEHHRTLPFTYEPVSDSTAIYTSMLSTNIIASNQSNNMEQSTSGYTRTARARSATLPISVTHNMTRGTDFDFYHSISCSNIDCFTEWKYYSFEDCSSSNNDCLSMCTAQCQ